MEDALGPKIATTLILALGTALSGLSPLWLSKSVLDPANRRQRSTLNALLSFSGGVLFATCFVHLLPDVHDDFETALPALVPPQTKRVMPWGELAVCLGFFLIYGVEEVVEYFVCSAGCEEKHHHHEEKHAGHNQETIISNTATKDDGDVTTSLSVTPSSVSYQNLESGRDNCMSPVHRIHGTHRKPHRKRHCKRAPAIANGGIAASSTQSTLVGALSRPLSYRSEDDNDERQSLLSKNYSDDNDDEEGDDDESGNDDLFATSDDNNPACQSHHTHHECESATDAPKTSTTFNSLQNTMRGLMLVLALSFHSIFEGLAIGLQGTVSGVWTSFLAVILHKLVMAFCVGVELLQLRTRRPRYVANVLAFASVAPVGIALGTLITEPRWAAIGQVDQASTDEVSTAGLVLASLQGLACGTLLYVTFFEVLTRTRGTELKSLLNFVAVVIGFALIVLIHLVD